MKLAICLYGEFREFEYSVTSLPLWEKFNPDYYISTWDSTEQISDILDIKIVEEIDDSKILKHIPNAKISVQNQRIVDGGDNEAKLHHHWKTLVKMIKESYLTYDLIILRRIDSFVYDFEEQLFLNTDFEKNKIFITGGLYYREQNSEMEPFIDDNLFIGKPETIIKFIESLPKQPMVTHFGIAKHLINLGIKIEDLNFCQYLILRPTMRKYLTNNYEKNSYLLKEKGRDLYKNWCDNRN